MLHKCGPLLGTQGGLAAAGERCLHSESVQMWGSHYTLIHGGRRAGLTAADASTPSRQREALGGAGRAGCRQRPWSCTARGRGPGPV